MNKSSEELPMKFGKEIDGEEKGDLSFKDLASQQNLSQEDMESTMTDTSKDPTYSLSQEVSDNKDVSYSQGNDEEYTSEDEYQEDNGSSSEEEISVTLKNEK